MLLAVVVGGWLAGWWLLWRLPGLDRVTSSGVPARGPKGVAVVVPARNEAETLPLLLRDLAGQTQRPDQIIVVDDGSVDATAAVAGAAGATVLAAGDPPDGWAGKPWACWTGSGATTAPRLVFLDADVRLAPDALARLVATHDRTGGLLSVEPSHVVGRRIEALSLVPNIVTMAGTGTFTPRPTAPTVAFGPCLVCDHDDYRAAGGHAAVRHAVAEDAALAQRFRAAGLAVTIRAGRDAVTFRMYSRGVRPLVEGWTKNLAVGAGAAPPYAAGLAAVWVAAMLASPMLMVRLGATSAALFVYGAVAGQVAWMARRLGRFGAWPVLLYPFVTAVFVALYAWSAVQVHVRGSVTWRGRRIGVGRAS